MKVLFCSLGCDKNLVDTEVMLGILAEGNYEFADDENEAEAAVVNTCCFINDAKEESIQTILDLAEFRKSGQLKALIVTGCLAQRYFDEMKIEIPEVDAVLGIASIEHIKEALDNVLSGEQKDYKDELTTPPLGGMRRELTTGGYYAYLKIAEGCSKHCTYCIIPYVRGEYRSVPMDKLIQEANDLASKGVKELILVAQETTLYGKDFDGQKHLPELLRELCKIEGLQWIRVLYCYPEEITPELIRTMKEEPKICKYLDIPIQSGSDEILRRMGRWTDSASIKALIDELRREIPDICLRTSLISGFPGETKSQHEETVKFVKEIGFDRLGVFTYSAEEGTLAAEMPDQIKQSIKEKRRDEIMKLQQEIAFAKSEAMIGTKMTAFIEGMIPEDGVAVARTYMDAPGVDGQLFIETDRTFMSGDMVHVLITDANGYDLIGVLD